MGTRTFVFQFGRLCLEHDRDYGIDRRTGWSVVSDGSVIVQFVSLLRALRVLAQEWWTQTGEGRK